VETREEDIVLYKRDERLLRMSSSRNKQRSIAALILFNLKGVLNPQTVKSSSNRITRSNSSYSHISTSERYIVTSQPH
jgi:hypothetical protein